MIHAALYLINVLIAAALVPSRWTLGGDLIAAAGRAFGSPVGIALGLLALDLGFYSLHRLQHALPLLWRLHMVHHSDLDVDVSTAVRHHPAEFLVNCLALGTLTVVLGIPPGAVAIYGVLALAVQMIQHANHGWPPWLERIARMIVVTPAMHCRHHSRDWRAGNSNFGIVFSLWDRLFHSFDSRKPVASFGVDGIDWPQCRSLWAILGLPLARRSRSDETHLD